MARPSRPTSPARRDRLLERIEDSPYPSELVGTARLWLQQGSSSSGVVQAGAGGRGRGGRLAVQLGCVHAAARPSSSCSAGTHSEPPSFSPLHCKQAALRPRSGQGGQGWQGVAIAGNSQ